MKRVLAWILCGLLCISLLPAAFAETVEIIDVEPAVEEGLESREGVGLISTVDESGEDIVVVDEPAAEGTDAATQTAESNSKPAITTHPKTTTVSEGVTVKFTVKATGGSLTYQWYYRTSSTGTWTKCTGTGYNTATLSVKAVAYREGYQYRCLVKNSSGSIYTNNAALHILAKPAIKTHPKTTTVAEGETAKFTVAATGGNLSYQWYYRVSSTGTWTKCTGTGCNTATLSVKAVAYREGYQYRCLVTNSLGSIYTNNAALHLLAKPAIKTQPASKTANENATVKFTVAASGGNLSYQWQYRTSSSGTWKNSTTTGCKTATLSVKAEGYRSGYQYRCKVKNSLGTVYSKAATLTVNLVKYRALLVGEETFTFEDVNMRNRGDVLLMQKMLKSVKGPTGGSYSVTCKYDLSNNGIKNAISSTFAGADSNDVSLFFIATHGVTNISSGIYAGEMVTVTSDGNEYLTMYDLATWLKTVPGKVIVLIGSCGSGAAIVENGNYKFVSNEELNDQFNEAVIQAFAALDEELPNENGEVANTGEFRNSKFYVMTAAAHMQSSWGWEGSTVEDSNNFFPYFLAQGVMNGKPADANNNGVVTMLELFNYIEKCITDVQDSKLQDTKMYPENSTYSLFK